MRLIDNLLPWSRDGEMDLLARVNGARNSLFNEPKGTFYPRPVPRIFLTIFLPSYPELISLEDSHYINRGFLSLKINVRSTFLLDCQSSARVSRIDNPDFWMSIRQIYLSCIS